jgi:hypothetical protein
MFAVDRIDTWVFRVGMAIPLVCLAGLVLWHLLGFLSRKLGNKRTGRNVEREAWGAGPPSSRSAPHASHFTPFVGTEDASADRTRRAGELLALTRDDFSKQRFSSCLDRCKALAETFSDLPEGAEAKQLATQIKNDPDRLERACAALVGSLADLYLELAECWLRKGEPEQAAAALRKLIQTCPETQQAQMARDRLKVISNQ